MGKYFKRCNKFGAYLITLAAGLLMCACSGLGMFSGKSDSAPQREIDAAEIPDAVPKNEPRSKYGNPRSYVVLGKRYHVMESSNGFVEKGIASWYGTKFHGRRTSSGETYDMYAMTAAHKNLPLPTYVKVTNLENNRHVIVKVNDRGPFHENRIIDLSYAAATRLDIIRKGTGWVEIRAIRPGESVAGSDDAPGAPVEVKTEVKTAGDGFYIQVGSFSNLVNAQNLRKKLDSFGERLVKISQAVVRDKVLYRVRIGPINDIDFADSIVSKLADFGVTEHQIVN